MKNILLPCLTLLCSTVLAGNGVFRDFQSCDLNKDGIIIFTEASNRACMGGADREDFQEADLNHDQRVTFAEFRLYFENH